MINDEEGKRDKWSAWAINVDHPLRKEAGIRDNTIIVKTIKSNATGLHCSHLVLDDVVVPQNAYTETGRREVRAAVSQFASIKNPGAVTKAVGTVYHPKDIYSDMMEAKVPVIDKETGAVTGERKLWDVWKEAVEDSGDGTGNFLWPRTKDPKTGKWYGFDASILAGIKAQYFSMGERAQFYAQYYNEANDPESHRLSREVFQYYDPKYLRQEGGEWFFKGDRLRVFAAVDFAYTSGTQSDYTAIAVIGRCAKGYIYVLDLDRFRTTKYEEYYRRILDMHLKWGFRKLRVETNAGANLICEYIKDRIREEGVRFTLDGKNTSSRGGSKEQRIAAILEPRYENGDVWHPRSGLVMELEEELMLERPAHDDLKDALAAAVEISSPPMAYGNKSKVFRLKTHPRFGGIVR
jgi:phage terminase large subunit-like protein